MRQGVEFGTKLVFAAIVFIMIFIAATSAAYYRDDIKNPAAGERSVPPPITN